MGLGKVPTLDLRGSRRGSLERREGTDAPAEVILAEV